MNTPKASPNFFINNFNLIRLFAAAQVAHFHIFHILGVPVGTFHVYLTKFLGLFPGVPIFFFVSGFLISKSWESSKTPHSYFFKRAVRIYPALIFSVIFAIILLYASGYLKTVSYSFYDIIILFLSKSSFLQPLNPDFIRGYGDGVLNGSLWTITVELQFYLLIPIIYFIGRYLSSNNFNKILVSLLIIFLILNIAYTSLLPKFYDTFYFKLFKVTFIPWFYMFLTGVLFQKNFKFLYSILSGKFLYLLFFYLVAAISGYYFFSADLGNTQNPILFFLLALTTFSAAFTMQPLSDRMLGNQDISYGIYIYHMPILNFCLYLGIPNGYTQALLISTMVLAISFLSWNMLEKKFLRLKLNLKRL